MTKVLHIEASPRRERSASSEAARFLLERLGRQYDGFDLDHLDLWREDLPPFDDHVLAAKYARLAGASLSADQAAAWAHIAAMVRRLDAADVVVISTPMWNFSIPYRLKHYIDLITQPGLTFTFDPATGYAPLLRARPLYVLLASAGDYRLGPSRGRPDLATPYLTEALAFLGLGGGRFISVGPTVGAPADTEVGRRRALDEIAALEPAA